MRKIPVINANEYAFDDGTIRLVSAYEQKSYISKSLKKVCLYGSSCLILYPKSTPCFWLTEFIFLKTMV